MIVRDHNTPKKVYSERIDVSKSKSTIDTIININNN